MTNKLKILMVFLLPCLLTSCISCGDVDNQDFDADFESTESAFGTADTTSADTVSTITESATTNTSTTNSGKDYTLKIESVSTIHSVIEFNYLNGVAGNYSVILQDGGLILSKIEKDLKWESSFKILASWTGRLITLGKSEFYSTVQDYRLEKLKIGMIVANNEVESLEIGNYKLTKSTPVGNKTTSSSLVYGEDSRFVVVQRGQTLRILIQLYNKENPSLGTNEDTILKNIRQLNGLKTNTIHVGDIIQMR